MILYLSLNVKNSVHLSAILILKAHILFFLLIPWWKCKTGNNFFDFLPHQGDVWHCQIFFGLKFECFFVFEFFWANLLTILSVISLIFKAFKKKLSSFFIFMTMTGFSACIKKSRWLRCFRHLQFQSMYHKKHQFVPTAKMHISSQSPDILKKCFSCGKLSTN